MIINANIWYRFLHLRVPSKIMLERVIFALSSVIVVLSANSCNFNVKLNQNLLGDGFHRNLTYGIVFNAEDGEDPQLTDCLIGLDQTLPPGVYANPDELDDLKRTHRLNVIPKTRINVELPTEQSAPSGIYIIGRVVDNKAYLWVPLHARYHQAVAGGGMAASELPPPALLARCARLAACARGPAPPALCNGAGPRCEWKQLPYTLVSPAPRWRVPVGDSLHWRAAAAGTALALVAGTVHLLRSLHLYTVRKR